MRVNRHGKIFKNGVKRLQNTLKHVRKGNISKKPLSICSGTCYSKDVDRRHSLSDWGCHTVAKYTAQQIARWFLSYNNVAVAEDGAELISNLKLQKLLYYAQGIYLGITGNKLFDEPLCAWTHGPVVEAVYHIYKQNGSNGIEYSDDEPTPKLTPEANAILKTVYDNFGQFSAWKLREMSHQETPWKETKPGEIIDIGSIKDFFAKEYIEQ